ncbi:hypothetical protein ACQJBY_053278 [Aegilops geniculata]
MPSHRRPRRPELPPVYAHAALPLKRRPRRHPSVAPLQRRTSPAPCPRALSPGGHLSPQLHPAKLPPPPWPELPNLHHEGTRSGGGGELDPGSMLLGKGIDTAEVQLLPLVLAFLLLSLSLPWRHIVTVGWRGKECSGGGEWGAPAVGSE